MCIVPPKTLFIIVLGIRDQLPWLNDERVSLTLGDKVRVLNNPLFISSPDVSTAEPNCWRLTNRLIEKLNEQSFISICMVKQQIRDVLNLTFEKSIENETVNQNSRFQHQDVVEGMTAFFEKRQPNYKNTLDE